MSHVNLKGIPKKDSVIVISHKKEAASSPFCSYAIDQSKREYRECIHRSKDYRGQAENTQLKYSTVDFENTEKSPPSLSLLGHSKSGQSS